MTQSITNISVDVLKVHPRNAEFFDDISGEEYDRFKKSIQDDGLLSPLIVAPDMTVISGHQRLKACKELGFRSVPVIIKDDLEDEDEKLKKLIAANFGRLKNSPIKQAKVYDEYSRLCGIKRGGNRKSNSSETNLVKQEDIARELGVSVGHLNDMKRLLTLVPELQEVIDNGTISAKTGSRLLANLTEEEQIQLVRALPATEKITQGVAQQYIDQMKGLTKENADLRQEAVEATRAVKASTDSEEYVRMQKKLKEEEEKSRKYYEDLQAEKKKNDEKPPKPDKIKEAVTKAVDATKKEYKKLIDQLQKEVDEAKENTETPDPEIVEVIPKDYEQAKRKAKSLEEENQRLLDELSSLKTNTHAVRSISLDLSEEELTNDYYMSVQQVSGTFVPEFEGFLVSADRIGKMTLSQRETLAHNVKECQNVLNRFMIALQNYKEVAA